MSYFNANGEFIYDTFTLAAVVQNLYEPSTFFQDRFFPQQVLSNDENVAIDIDVGIRRMAPFCSPLVEGKVVESNMTQTKAFKPPYIKSKRYVPSLRPQQRMIGERIGGNQMTGQERMQANVAREVKDDAQMLDRRIEWMAIQSLMNGGLTIEGKGYETSYINFGRDPSLNIVLSGDDMWDSPNSNKKYTQDLNKWAQEALKISGARITDIICTDSAFNALITDPIIIQQSMVSGIRGNNDVNLQMGPMVYPSAVLKGMWGGFRVWSYYDWYVDEDNVQQPMIPDGLIIGVSDQLDGLTAYGLILDPKLGYVPAPFAPKIWYQEDPAQVVLMTQSSPLTIPTRINASFVAHVAKGNDNG